MCYSSGCLIRIKIAAAKRTNSLLSFFRVIFTIFLFHKIIPRFALIHLLTVCFYIIHFFCLFLLFLLTDGGGGHQERDGRVSIERKDGATTDAREGGGQRKADRIDARETINYNGRHHWVRDKRHAPPIMHAHLRLYRATGHAAYTTISRFSSHARAFADMLWKSGERIELTNGGKIAKRLSDSVGAKNDDFTVLFALHHPTFEIRLLSKSPDRSVPYFSIAVPGTPRPDWLLPYGIGLDLSKRIIFYDYSQGEEGIAMLRWPNKLTVTHLTDWPAERLRFSTHLERGEFRVYAIRCAKVLPAVSNPSDPWEFVCHLTMKPELLGLATPVCMISAGCSVEICAIDEQ